MTHSKDLPLFNLKAVVTETGLKPDTLRAWERRYGIPSPKRTPSGHRLYSQNDIDMLHWLIARQQEGLSISRAVEMWERARAESGEEALPPLPETAAHLPVQPVSELHDDALRGVREQWIAACLRFDEQTAEQALAQAFALFTPEMVCLEVIQKGLATIGEGWYRGRVTVQQEHFASALALRRLESMLAATPPPTRAGRILIGCPPEEEHTFVPLLLSLLLRRRGWDTVYLGANVPVVSLEATIASARPHLVILTAQQLATAASLLEMAEVLLHERIPLAFGGLIFNRLPDLARAIPGYFLGGRLDGSVTVIEALMANLRVQLPQRATPPEYREALRHFRAQQAHLEAEVWRHMHEGPLPARMLAAANHHFSRNIAASLALGSMEYVGADIEWLEGLLVNHIGMPPERVDDYLEVYLAAARSVLGEPGRPVVEWLAALVGAEPLRGEAVPAKRGVRPARAGAAT